MDNKKKILDRVKENKGYITSKELKEMKINRFYLSELKKEGKLEMIKRGVYKNAFYVSENEFLEISKLVPNGVLCLETAIDYYNLSTNVSDVYQVAIPLKSKIKIPDYPPIKIMYFSDKNYSLGKVNIKINGINVKIYDLEKTVCDITRYRNKLGMSLFSEVLKEYLKRKDRDLTKLMNYAKDTNTYKILKGYLEVLI